MLGNDEIPTVKPKLRRKIPDDITNVRYLGYRVEKDYINGLGKPIHVTDASNFKCIVNSKSSLNANYAGYFTVRLTYFFDQTFLKEIDRANNDEASHQIDDSLMELIREELRSLEENPSRMSKSSEVQISIEVQVTETDILNRGGTVHIQGTDNIISLIYKKGEIVHPLSHKGMIEDAEKVARRRFNKENDQLFFTIKYVDNSLEKDARFINILNQPVMIEPVMDPNKDSGAYITVNTRHFKLNKGLGHVAYFDTVFIPTDKMNEETGFYDTFEKAKVSGEPAIVLEKLEHENNVLKKELQIEKSRIDKENVDLERKLSKDKRKMEKMKLVNEKLKLESDRLKAELEVLKQKYSKEDAIDKQHLNRFDNESKFLIEGLKFVTVLIGGIFTISKLFGKSGN